MSRSLKLMLAAAACVVALLACGSWVLVRDVESGVRYPDAEKYAVGGTTLDGKVKNLDIHWTAGAVAIAYHAQDTVVIDETAKDPISDDDTLRWYMDGDTLRIQYAKSDFSKVRHPYKALTVTLPEGTELDSLAIDATSARIDVPDLHAGEAVIDVNSGSIDFKMTGAAKRVTLSSTSGAIRANLADLGALSVETTSGNVQAAFASVDEASVSVTSGDIAIQGGSAKRAKIDITSGKVDVALKAFDALTIDSTSGNVTATLPSKPGYQADIDTTGGKFDYAVPLTRQGDGYTCGDGSASLRISTTSGNILLKDK